MGQQVNKIVLANGDGTALGVLNADAYDGHEVTKVVGGASIKMPKAFQSGALGYYAGGKVSLPDGEYQCSVSLVRLGTKDEKRGKLVTEAKKKIAELRKAAQTVTTHE